MTTKHPLPADDSKDAERSPKRSMFEHHDLHCFGMISDLACENELAHDMSDTPIPLIFVEASPKLQNETTQADFANLTRTSHEIMRVLSRELTLQIFADEIMKIPADPVAGDFTTSTRKKNTKTRSSLGVCVVLYGPLHLLEAVGTFTTTCKLFLQHPRHFDRKVPYRNPQCLTSETAEVIYTSQLGTIMHISPELTSDGLQDPIDLFADSEIRQHLATAQSPPALCTTLYRHQEQALTFMLQRETGWALQSEIRKDIWKVGTDDIGRRLYFNIVSGQKRLTPPRDFRGGLLIDAPGLGKSLSIISLILSAKEDKRPDANGEDSLPTTLLVVPKTLIETWKDELKRHLKSTDQVKLCVYYGKDKVKYLSELRNYDLVITTYSVVRIDWKSKETKPDNPLTLHSIKWRRIVLDEAHVIREHTKSFARSVCALKADRRWAVTGTPIQNRLKDLYSLFKFLQCTPFDDWDVFERHVTQNWRKRSDPESLAKLKTLVNYLSLRRPKATVPLPARKNDVVRLTFSTEERQLYDQVKHKTHRQIELVGCRQSGVTFLNALHWVNELRHICIRGLTKSKSVQNLETVCPERLPWSQTEAQRVFEQLEKAELARCSNPSCSQDLASALSSEIDTEHMDEPYVSRNDQLLCHSCYDARTERHDDFFRVCNHLPRSPGNVLAQETVGKSGAVVDENHVPTKIKRLLEDLAKTPEGIKSVVFSGWTETFDIIQPLLHQRSIRCVRLDGTLSTSGRDRVIRAFRENDGIAVLLATITCGGVGLDLTAASRAYIMEPQWNPMSESQALDRVHRLGQRKEVKTIRYIIQGSWEEQVLTLQKHKQLLSDLTLEGGATDKSDLTRKRLEHLKHLVG